MLQLLFQIPVSDLHKNEKSPDSWQSIIGFYSLWDLNKEGLPKVINVSNVVYKCFMYAFIILQQQIFSSQEYKDFIFDKIKKLKDVSAMRGKAMAYRFNNYKIQTTIKNQIEKDNMIKKLTKVDKQVKEWNQMIYSKAQAKKPKQDVKSIEFERNKLPKIYERAEEENSVFDDELLSLKQSSDKESSESSAEINEKKQHYLANYQDLEKSNLIKKLVNDKLNFIWRLHIFLSRNLTNEILLVAVNSKE